VQDDKVIKEISYADTERILGTLKIDYENVSEGTCRFQHAGYKTLLLSKKKNLQLYALFKHKSSLVRINEYYRKKISPYLFLRITLMLPSVSRSAPLASSTLAHPASRKAVISS
jgi:hypothetical protein